MVPMLTVTQAAELKGCSVQYVRKAVRDGKLHAVETVNEKNRKTYRIPLTEFNEELQKEWYLREKGGFPAKIPEEAGSDSVDCYSKEERDEIDFWVRLVEKWQQYRAMLGAGSKAEVDAKFEALCKLEYPERNLSIKTLYRKWDAIMEKDYGRLVDKRGKWKKGKSSIDDAVWQAFLYYYLDESQPPIRQCLTYTELWARERRPELYAGIPSYSAFYRRLQNDLPEGVKVLGREGEKAFRDRCAPYIKRIYDDLSSNEWWIADNHTFDVFVKDREGKLHRPYLTAFLDARSGIFTGYYITYNPSSEATLIALRKGILQYGIPENIYVDNGREFLTFDIGGLGHRKKKPKDGVEKYEPPGVFQRLGIHMTNAIVRNAKAKIIERRFLDVKNDLSKLFRTYTGGNVKEKPERLKRVLKKEEVYTDEQFHEIVEALVDWYFNMEPYNGAVAADRGKKKMDVFHEYLKKQRRASAEELNLMLMRSSRPQKVGRRGVHLDIAGARIDYWNDDFLQILLGKQVYFRYNPEDLSEIRVYDLEDRYLMNVPADNQAICSYNSGKEDVKAAMQKTRRFEKIVKEYKESLILDECDRVTSMELVLAQANRNKETYQGKVDPAVVELQRAVEEPLYQKVVGGADLDTMNKNAMKKQGGGEHGI